MHASMTCALLIVVATCGSSVAHAQAQSGSFFLQACTAVVKTSDGGQITDKENEDFHYCAGYVRGFVDALRVMEKNKVRQNVCLPAGVSLDQTVRVFVKYLRENPQTLHQEGRTSLYAALAKAFPCSK